MSFQQNSIVRGLSRIFPAPTFLVLPAAGVDISDSSVKWVLLSDANSQNRVASYGEIRLSPGIVENGVVRDGDKLTMALKEMKKKIHPTTHIHMSLPEESVYVFLMRAPHASSREHIRTLVEFEFENRVPLSIVESVYDFDIIHDGDGDAGMELVVTVFPREIALQYIRACENAGLTVLSLENELFSTAWAVIDTEVGKEGSTLLIDFGGSRTGIACVHDRVPLFTATIPVGSGQMTENLMASLGITENQADTYKDTEGLSTPATTAGYKALIPIADTLVSQVERYFRLWGHEKDSTANSIQQAVMVGGGANVRGLPEYLSQKIRIPVSRGNVWCKVASFHDYIPPIEYDISLKYATAIGLALRGISL